MNKSIIYKIIIVLVLAGLVWAGYDYYKNKPAEKELTLQEILQLQESERVQALEDRVKDLRKEVSRLADSAEGSVKYTAYIQLAEAQLELSKFDDALSSLAKIPEDKRGNSRYGVVEARAYKGKGEVTKAKEISANNVVAYDLEPSAWLAHFDINFDLPNDQLKAIYLQAITATKSQLDIMISYAKFSEKIGDKATAIAAWETAVNHDPGNEAKYKAEIDRLKQ